MATCCRTPSGRPRGRRRRALVLALALIAGAVGLYVRAQQTLINFERMPPAGWEKPQAGGMRGGAGAAALVTTGASDFARSGARAVRLDVWNLGTDPTAVAWAAVSQVYPCRAGRKVRIGAWLYFSSSIHPLADSAVTAQLRIEYYTDAAARNLYPMHIYLGPPFNPAAGYGPDTWHLVEGTDRAPPGAVAMRVSLVLAAQHITARQTVWADDVFVEIQSARPGSSLALPGRALACVW